MTKRRRVGRPTLTGGTQPSPRLSLAIPRALLRELRQEARVRKITMSDVIRERLAR